MKEYTELEIRKDFSCVNLRWIFWSENSCHRTKGDLLLYVTLTVARRRRRLYTHTAHFFSDRQTDRQTDRRKRRPTNCNECWTLQPVWSAVLISLTEACRDSSIPSYIGWMFLSESCTNSASWCSTVYTVKRLSTSWNCANQPQVSHHGNIFDPPPNISWSYRVTSSAPMVDRLSVWLVRQSGIPCWTACGIQLLTRTVSDNLWRRFCLQRTDAFSALEVSRRCAIQINFLLTYLLTYLWTYVINSAQICCSQHRGFDSVGVKICHLPLTWPVDINTVLALLHSLW